LQKKQTRQGETTMANEQFSFRLPPLHADVLKSISEATGEPIGSCVQRLIIAAIEENIASGVFDRILKMSIAAEIDRS